jgi:hypothetical protein
MTARSFLRSLSLFASVALLFVVAPAEAQQARPAGNAPRLPLRIKDLPKVGKAALVNPPEIDGKVRSSGRKTGKRQWASFEITYQTTHEWIDEVSVTFHVMCRATDKSLHLFQTSVTYLDIAKGEHGACVLLPPSAVERYGEPIAVGVELSFSDETVQGFKVPPVSVGAGKPEWWTDLGSLKVTTHGGYLKDRSQTPFSVVNSDEYEVVR